MTQTPSDALPASNGAETVSGYAARLSAWKDEHHDCDCAPHESCGCKELSLIIQQMEIEGFSLRRKVEETEAALIELTRSFAVYLVEDDDGIRFATHGVLIAHWGQHTPEGIALLRLDALARALQQGGKADG